MEEKILAAKAQYDQLTKYEKSIVSDEIKEKLDNLLFQLYDYRIIQGAGSTLITLMPEYMESLASGEHTLTVSYTDGQTSCKLYVEEKGETITSDTIASDTGSPKTGDSSNWILWTAILLIAGIVILIGVIRSRKGKNSQ